jgi:thiol-disulfide isomerase/thioredoxin
MKKKYLIILLIILVVAIAVPFFLGVFKFVKKFESLNNQESSETPYNLKSSKIALLNIRTQKVDTIQLKKIVVLNFWASWCAPCIKEYPFLENLQTKYGGITVLQASFDSLNYQISTIKKYNWKLPAFLIKDETIFKIPPVLPKTIILHDSTVVKEIFGYHE